MSAYLAARIAGPLAAIILLVGGWLYIRVLRLETEQAQKEAAAAVAKAELATRNGQLSMRIMDRHARLSRERAERIADLEKVIARERPPLPAVCARALDPVRDAVDGVRSLRAMRGNAPRPATAAVPGRP